MPGDIDYDLLRLDALREVGMIGAGHATTALAEMTGRPILIDVPDAVIVHTTEVSDLIGLRGAQTIMVVLRTLGDLTGLALFVLAETDARRLGDILLHRPFEASRDFSVLERSSLEEAGNIVAAAYLNALSIFLGMMLMPSVPTLVRGEASAVIESEMANSGGDENAVVCIAARFAFREPDADISGHYLFLPDAPAIKSILAALQLD